MVMVITNENQSENAFSTYLLRLGLALESFKEPLQSEKFNFRSLFSGAKRWFGTNKGNPSGGTSVVYSREAPELQVWKFYCLVLVSESNVIGAEAGGPLLLDEDVQAGVQLCLHQQEGLSDGRGGDLLFSLGGCFMFPWIGLALLRSCRRTGRTLHVHALQY